jgi:HAD superfamily phosphatase (TIGR01668 family)
MLPDFFADSVLDIDFDTLHKHGVRYLVLDVDHTLAVYNAMELDPATMSFLRRLHDDGPVEGIFIASNSRRDLKPMADSVGAEIVRPGRWQRKPSRAFFGRLLQEIGCRPEEAVMVGDKMFNDIWGGNRAGMYTILVKPLGPDMLVDKLLLRRFIGERYLKRRGGRRAG